MTCHENNATKDCSPKEEAARNDSQSLNLEVVIGHIFGQGNHCGIFFEGLFDQEVDCILDSIDNEGVVFFTHWKGLPQCWWSPGYCVRVCLVSKVRGKGDTESK